MKQLELVGSVKKGKRNPKDIDFRTFDPIPLSRETVAEIANHMRSLGHEYGLRQGDLWFADPIVPSSQVTNRAYLCWSDDGWIYQTRHWVPSRPKGYFLGFKEDWR
ncbi:hypothetical protein ES703_39893 [subsurface metagenome]